MQTNWKSCPMGLLLSLLLVTTTGAQAPSPATGQHPQSLDKQVTIHLNYLLFLPEAYASQNDAKFPMILFLHGAGERGSDIEKVKVHGPPKIVEKKKEFPFIVVSPQCPQDAWWDACQLITLLDDVQSKYRVDPDRVYVTGLSMGGFGTWDLALRNGDRFAAIAPICGAGVPAMARRLRTLPTWVFHGDADPIVPVRCSDDMVDALKKAGGDVKYTRYPGVGHDAWTATYNNPELYDWFLAHRRSDRKPDPATRR